MAISMTQAYPEPPAGAMQLGRRAWVMPSRLTWTYTTARGPGGQHVNKASTAAVLRVALTDLRGLDEDALERLRAMAGSVLVGGGELLFRCDLHRSQLMNREACQARLTALVRQAEVRPKVRKKTRPTRGSIERRLDGERKSSERKQNRRWNDE